MRDLDDPANPYRELYAEWDYYCFANARGMSSEERRKWNRHQVPLTRRWIDVYVDADGFPVPIMQSHTERMEWYRDRALDQDGSCVNTYEVYADVPEDLDQRMYAAEQAIRARLVPVIPRWLALNPPQKALRLPDGSFVASGELGSGRAFGLNDAFLRDTPPFKSYHFSPDGQLLAQTGTGEDWYTMFWPDAERVLSQYDGEATYISQDNGYLFVQQIEDWITLAVYNYDGTPLPLETTAASRDRNVWEGWYGREIMMLYAAQQH